MNPPTALIPLFAWLAWLSWFAAAAVAGPAPAAGPKPPPKPVPAVAAPAPPSPAPTRPPDADRRTPVVIAVERATPAVVTVEVAIERQNPFFGTSLGASAGSGVVFHPSGIVVTNAHVVEGAREITVHTSTGGEWSADVMALDTDIDLAVLQVHGAPPMTTVELGNSDELMLGETVIAIGNAMGLGLTVSTGVIGSVARDVEVRAGLHQSFIQTDAAINPGNSGGALVDINGRLIGINTAIRQDAQGIGFAIPVGRARKIAQDLVSYGSVRAPWLGVEVSDLDERSAPLPGGAVRVDGVTADGPAAKVGIAKGDLVYQLDGHPVASRSDLNSWLASHSPGDPVVLKVWRQGATTQATVATLAVPDDIGKTALRDVLGVQLTPQSGVLVVAQASSSGGWVRARLKVGDAIVAADGREVHTVAELEDAIRRARGQHRGSMLVTVRRGPYQGHVSVPIG